jgi:long-subunit fatty acid transport protein
VTRRALGLAVAVLAAWAQPPCAVAQDSVFGIRGLGFLGRPISARSAGTAGGYGVFDGSSALNPASLAAWRGAVGWAVGAGTVRSFDPGSGALSLSSTRFPVFGFAVPVSARLVVGISASDYLNRNWTVTRDTTIMPRDSLVAVTDQTRSAGGVTDIRLAAAYRLSETVAVGLGLHALAGSSQTSVRRDFPTDSAYSSFQEYAETDYSGFGVSVGLFVTPWPKLILGASARVNGRLEAASPSDTARVRLPAEFNGGVYYRPSDGVMFASTVGYATWSAATNDLKAAGQPPSRDVWSVGVGVEAALLRLGRQSLPVRVGYRWRQLPFPIGGSPLNEHAFAAGFGFTAAGGRATVDVAVESGSRSAGPLVERFVTALVGVSVLP